MAPKLRPMSFRLVFASSFSLLASVACGGETESPGSTSAVDTAFVAVGAGSFALSADGVTWDVRPYGSPFVAARAASARGRVVAVGRATDVDRDARQVAVTTDLRTWRVFELPFGDCSITDVAVVGERFTITGMSWETGSCVATSTDGEAWSLAPGAPSAHMFHEIARGRDGLIAAAWYRSDLMTPAVYAERDGSFRALATVETSARGAGGFDGAVDAGGRIALVRGGGQIWSWEDVSRFDPVPDGAPSDEASWHAIMHADGKLLVHGELSTSANQSAVGVRADVKDAPLRVVLRRTDGRIRGAARARGRFVVVGDGGYVADSTDAEAWTEHRAGAIDLADVVATSL